MLTMYGIKNCDTIKKARRWLEAHQIEYRFHDYRADGLERAQLDTFIAELGWQALLNTRGTTWRKLDESLRNSIDNADAAAALILFARGIGLDRLVLANPWTIDGDEAPVAMPAAISVLPTPVENAPSAP